MSVERSVLKKRLERRLDRLTRSCQHATQELSFLLRDFTNDRMSNMVLVSEIIIEDLLDLLSKYHHASESILKTCTQAHQTIDSSDISSLCNYDLTKDSVGKCLDQPLDEKYFIEHLYSRTRLLYMLETSFELQETGLISQISYLKGICTTRGEISPDITEEYLRELEVECTKLASELATLNQLEVIQVQSRNKLVEKQNQLKHMNDVEGILRQENSWLRFLTNIVDLEHDSCKQALKELISISQSLHTLKDYSVQLLEKSASLYQSDDLIECDESVRNDVSKHFEDAVIHLLLTSPLPSELSEKLKTTENRSETILDILRSLKSRLVSSQDSIKIESEQLDKYIQQIRKQLLGLKETFDLPDSLISCDTPHLEQLNPDRIRFSWRGLCSTELTDLFVNTCKDINGLVEQLDRLELEADITFPHI
ncbi:unnamed protein product [Schistosoma mattheei]|uniref:Uncharacterized protein n=1 Tax=Schistosoma mattheei TaxID=31246 RepID=A0AA85BEY2_9TREM|nr:unnamed protein product [Schistosoma mattheei]